MDTVQHEILHRPDFGFLQVRLAPGQSIHAEPGAMASMDAGVKLKTSLKGGLWKSLKRGIGGESLVMTNFYTGEVAFYTVGPDTLRFDRVMTPPARPQRPKRRSLRSLLGVSGFGMRAVRTQCWDF